jgi:hypothetical protein
MGRSPCPIFKERPLSLSQPLWSIHPLRLRRYHGQPLQTKQLRRSLSPREFNQALQSLRPQELMRTQKSNQPLPSIGTLGLNRAQHLKRLLKSCRPLKHYQLQHPLQTLQSFQQIQPNMQLMVQSLGSNHCPESYRPLGFESVSGSA